MCRKPFGTAGNRPQRIRLRQCADGSVGVRGQGRVQYVLQNRRQLIDVEPAVLDAAIDVGIH